MLYFLKINSIVQYIRKKISIYLPLIKSLQTGLLLVTGFTGYISATNHQFTWQEITGLLVSLFLTICGSTVLNMVYDRNIDSKMKRTAKRPLPKKLIGTKEALGFGLFLSLTGLIWALNMSALYGLIIFSGLFLDVVVYTIWLKRKTAWSIVWGGISGGMPILAGRVLAIGHIDFIGLLLCLAVLLWIPTHILTFSMRFFRDYSSAGIPTFPSVYGYNKTRLIIAISSFGAALAICIGAYAMGLAGGYLRLLSVLSVGILGLSVFSIYRPSEEVNIGLFKYASLYMFGAMMMMIIGALK